MITFVKLAIFIITGRLYIDVKQDQKKKKKTGYIDSSLDRLVVYYFY